MFAGLANVGVTGVGRPVLEKTGLAGKVDFVIEFTPEVNGPVPPDAEFQPHPDGPTFMEALKEQLGLKLESQKGPVDVIVIDHVERPSDNSAQAPAGTEDRPKFDAVSIKVNKNLGYGRVNLAQPGSHLTATNVNLKFLIISGLSVSTSSHGAKPRGRGLDRVATLRRRGREGR